MRSPMSRSKSDLAIAYSVKRRSKKGYPPGSQDQAPENYEDSSRNEMRTDEHRNEDIKDNEPMSDVPSRLFDSSDDGMETHDVIKNRIGNIIKKLRAGVR